MAVMLRVRATLVYGTGGPGLFTSWWNPGTTGGVTADATDAVARVRAFFASAQAQYPTSTTITVQTDVALIESSTGVLVGSLSGAAVGTVVGTGGGTLGALANMALIRHRTNVVTNGRLIRGRWYMGPLAPGAVSSTGGLATGTITAFDTAAATLLAAGPTTTNLTIWHRPGAGVGLTSPVISSSTWNQVAVMRSRRDA